MATPFCILVKDKERIVANSEMWYSVHVRLACCTICMGKGGEWRKKNEDPKYDDQLVGKRQHCGRPDVPSGRGGGLSKDSADTSREQYHYRGAQVQNIGEIRWTKSCA